MLTLLKKIFIWWNQETLGTKLKTIFYGNLWEKILVATNITKANLEKDG